MIAIAATTLISCGGEEAPLKLSPKNLKVRGELGKYFKVVEKDVILTESTMFGKMIQVELEKYAEMPYDKSATRPCGTSGEGIKTLIGFGLKIFDKDNNIILQISPSATGTAGVYDSEDIKNLINIEATDTGIVRWAEDISDEDLKRVATFEITSVVETVKASRYSSSNNRSSNSRSSRSSNSAGSAEWDDILNEYDNYATEYISLARKANSGNITALSEAMEILESANALNKKIERNKGSLSSSQRSRFLRITSNIGDAIIGL